MKTKYNENDILNFWQTLSKKEQKKITKITNGLKKDEYISYMTWMIDTRNASAKDELKKGDPIISPHEKIETKTTRKQSQTNKTETPDPIDDLLKEIKRDTGDIKKLYGDDVNFTVTGEWKPPTSWGYIDDKNIDFTNVEKAFKELQETRQKRKQPKGEYKYSGELPKGISQYVLADVEWRKLYSQAITDHHNVVNELNEVYKRELAQSNIDYTNKLMKKEREHKAEIERLQKEIEDTKSLMQKRIVFVEAKCEERHLQEIEDIKCKVNECKAPPIKEKRKWLTKRLLKKSLGWLLMGAIWFGGNYGLYLEGKSFGALVMLNIIGSMFVGLIYLIAYLISD